MLYLYMYIYTNKKILETNEIQLINLLLNFIMKGYEKFLSA